MVEQERVVKEWEEREYFTSAEAVRLQSKLFEGALSIVQAKRQDYSGGGDPFKNFRMSEQYGVPAWKGCLIRLTDKLSRINQLGEKAGLGAVKDESILDTAMDVLNYTVILVSLILESAPAERERLLNGKS